MSGIGIGSPQISIVSRNTVRHQLCIAFREGGVPIAQLLECLTGVVIHRRIIVGFLHRFGQRQQIIAIAFYAESEANSALGNRPKHI